MAHRRTVGALAVLLRQANGNTWPVALMAYEIPTLTSTCATQLFQMWRQPTICIIIAIKAKTILEHILYFCRCTGENLDIIVVYPGLLLNYQPNGIEFNQPMPILVVV